MKESILHPIGDPTLNPLFDLTLNPNEGMLLKMKTPDYWKMNQTNAQKTEVKVELKRLRRDEQGDRVFSVVFVFQSIHSKYWLKPPKWIKGP